MPQNVRIRLNVGGTVFHTSLHTLMEGARRGFVVFQCLCVQILGTKANSYAVAAATGVAWAQRVVPSQAEQYRLEHFVDADPTPFPYWLDYFRTGRVPMVDATVRDKVVLESELAGLVELADALRSQVKQEHTELDDIKKELKETREELAEMQQQNTLFAGSMEDMRRQLDALQAQQAQSEKIVEFKVVRGTTLTHVPFQTAVQIL